MEVGMMIDPAGEKGMADEGEEHVVSKMPEIISKILTYLSKTDLLSCTQVNQAWEGQARKHLLSQVTVQLKPWNFKKYLDATNVRGNCHSSIHLRFLNLENELEYIMASVSNPDYLPLLRTFARRNAGKVRHLSSDWRLDAEIGPQYFLVWSLFTSLISLELRPFISQCVGLREDDNQRNAEALSNSMRELDNLIPPNIIFPTVKTLSFKVQTLDEEAKTILGAEGFASRILKMFPNVTALKFWNFWEPFFRADIDFQNLTSLSILTQSEHYSLHHNLQSVLDLPLKNITNLEFNLKAHINVIGGVADAGQNIAERQNITEGQDWGRILTKFAPTLAHLTIRHVRNTFRDIGAIGLSSPLELILPIMPKLKRITIHRSPHDNNWVWPWEDRNKGFLESTYPSLKLKFALGEENQDLGIDYPQQFPSLTHLAIVKEKDSRFLRDGEDEKQEPLDDEGFFETCVPFLHSSFLKGNNPSPSNILTHFNIIWPKGYEGDEEFKLLSGPACQCFENDGNSRCICWKWTKLCKFYDSIIQTFPKVANHETKTRLEL